MWAAADVEMQLREAAQTLQALPDRDAKFRLRLKSAWPDTVRQGLAAAEAGTKVRRPAPSPGAIDRLDVTIGWLAWLTEPQRRIAWALACGIPAAKVARLIGCHRNTVANRHAAALMVIAGRLNAGLAPVGREGVQAAGGHAA